MTIEELYEKLNSPGFQDTENGDIFYNFFIYQYPAEREYEIREHIRVFKENLIRPTSYVDVLALDLFEAFCDFLKLKLFLKKPMLDYLLDKELKCPDNTSAIEETLRRNAHSEEFLKYLHKRILEHIKIEDDKKRPYVFLYGVGSMYPYLRVNELLAQYEEYNETGKYKILVFYPGHREQNSFKLFDSLEDHHTYRATLLINE